MAPRVIIIDDEPADQALLRQGFQRVGSRAVVEVVPDVSVAIGLIEERGTPALLIVDLRLGSESGLELVQWVRDQRASRFVPIIVVSGSDNPADIRAAYEAGANAFVRKPVDLASSDALVRQIDEFWLGSAHLPTPADG